MQFINFSDDATLPRLCKWQFLCQLCSSLIMQTRCDLKPFWEKRERERARWFSHAVCEIMSHRNFSNYFKLFNEEIWIVQHYNYFTRAGQRLRRCCCMSCQFSHGRRIISLRSAFLETADQTSQFDYRPIVIGSRSIGAPLLNSKTLGSLLVGQTSC